MRQQCFTRTQRQIARWRRLLVHGLLVFLFSSAAVATPTPTRTPGPFVIRGIVMQPDGQPAPDVIVEGAFCLDRMTCLEPGVAGAMTMSAADGRFSLAFEDELAPVVVVTAGVDDVELRGLAVASRFATVDPISEAAVRLLENAGFENYDCDAVTAILQAVRQANATTDFAGLDVSAAVESAEAAAASDVSSQLALATHTPTATSTPFRTATPTPTATLRPTGTPRACVGDCNGDMSVTVDELITAVNIVLGARSPEACTAYYATSPPVITDLVVAVNNALDQCVLLPPAADLIPTSVQYRGPFACFGSSPLVIVCVANVGESGAGRFTVRTNGGEDQFDLAVAQRLEPGEQECSIRPFTQRQLTVEVDVDNTVAEAREDNNVATFMLSTPPPPPTCTASPSPTVVE